MSTDNSIIDSAIRLLVDDNESEEVLDILQKCSQQLLESSDNESKETMFCEELTQNQLVGNSSEELESIEDLTLIDDHMYHKSISLNSQMYDDFFAESDHNMDDNMNDYKQTLNINDIKSTQLPLSPLSSCHSDSGYESVASPALSLDETLSESNCIDLNIDSFTELFPDLV